MESFYMSDTSMQYMYDEYTLLEACRERDVEAVQAILDDNPTEEELNERDKSGRVSKPFILDDNPTEEELNERDKSGRVSKLFILDDNPTEEELNERDKSGRTPLSYACSLGLLPVVELLSDIPDVDVNLPDKEGNSPIIFAAQAGHAEIIKTLINDFPNLRIDQKNKFGMTALTKAAIQGRTKCAKPLLFAGANPKLRDTIRKITAEEWASYCGRKECAEEIAKFADTKGFLFNSGKKKLERSNSEPELNSSKHRKPHIPTRAKSRSFRRTIKKFIPGKAVNISINSMGADNPLAMVARCVSTPILPDAVSQNLVGSMKRPVSVDNIPIVKVTMEGKNGIG